MTFASPSWLWALFLLPVLFGLRIRAHMRSRQSLDGLVAPRLHALLVSGTSQIRHWMSFVLLVAGLAMIIVAMARPQWGFTEVESFTEGRSLILAIDTSRSMLATDLVPNRLERAKLAARDIVDSLGEDRIGLIAFAGKAFMQAPLTTDHQAVIESIEQIDTEVIPRGGTNLTSAASLALSSFREADAEQNALVIFSDGEALEGQDQVAEIKESANRENMIIITIGVGTENGSIIPEPGRDGRPQEGVFVKDAGGQVVRTRLDASALRDLATGGGIYLQLGSRSSMTKVVKSITANLASTREKDVARQRPIERFMWPLGIGLFFLVASQVVHLLFPLQKRALSRMPSAIKVAATLMLFSSSGFAKDGWKHIERENFETALKQFEISLKDEDITPREMTAIQLGIGSAAYKTGDFELATKAFGKALIRSGKYAREQAHYNLGNTLFRKGEATLNPASANPGELSQMGTTPEKIAATLQQWFGALEHYQAALNLNGKNADARHNIEVIKKRIELLKQEQQQQQPEQPSPEDQKQDPSDQPRDKEQQKEEPDNQDSGDQNKNEENGDEENQPKNSESDEGDGDGESQPPDQPEQPGDQPEEETAQPPETDEGELTADESSQAPEKEPNPADQRKNRETGYSPSEARQLIEALADENGDPQPVYPKPVRAEKFKNW
ncbi:MAG: VWA domain-containing protein [Verrucomicrobiales bacterium]|nr:VWA domain-containing protein [Verrucomicrobiales bacterium]